MLPTGFSPHDCAAMRGALANPEVPLVYGARLREHGIPGHDAGWTATIAYCPWCGDPLPPSLRDAWFDELDRLGLDPTDEERLPVAFRSDAWWRAFR